MIKFTPLFKFRGTTMWKAWVINAIIIGIISGFTVEIRDYMDQHNYTTFLPDFPHKLLATILISSFAGFITFFLSRVIFGTGEGMMESIKMHPELF
mgnify:FL=1